MIAGCSGDERLRGRRLSPSARVDLNTLDVLGCLFRLWQAHCQHAVAGRGFGFVFLDTLERILALAIAEELAFVVVLGLPLAANGKDAVGDFDLNVLLVHAGQLRRDRDGLVGFAELDFGPAELAFHQRADAPPERAKSRRACARGAASVMGMDDPVKTRCQSTRAVWSTMVRPPNREVKQQE